MKTSAHILIRVILIIIISLGAYYVAVHTYFWLSSIWLILLVILLIYDVIRIHRRSEKDLENFLLAISHHDFTTVLPSKVARDYPRLASAYTTINNVFQEISLSEESSHSFLEVIVEQVGVALIGFRTETGEITLINKVAKDLIGKTYLRNISSLTTIEPELSQMFEKMVSGDRSLLTLHREHENLQLSVVARELVLEGHRYKLFALQNIRSELEEKEIDSWIKLIKVLTHEIKNSAIPIATLSDVIAESITDAEGIRKDLAGLSEGEWDDLSMGLKTIRRRSKGLVDFIDAYSRFTKLPRPDKTRIQATELLSSVAGLLQRELDEKKVKCSITSEDNITLVADMIQMEQVLINLLKNAIHAVEKETGIIKINVFRKDQKIHITVTDNGPGMDAALLENVFIPFYTTKEKGTGVGLSISRQIIRAHKGELKVSSYLGEGTTFEIVL